MTIQKDNQNVTSWYSNSVGMLNHLIGKAGKRNR